MRARKKRAIFAKSDLKAGRITKGAVLTTNSTWAWERFNEVLVSRRKAILQDTHSPGAVGKRGEAIHADRGGVRIGKLLKLKVTPESRRKDVVIMNDSR